MARKSQSNALNPLPSLIHASAQDVGDRSMRSGNRKAWSRKDYNASVECQNRLIKQCYGRSTDKNEMMAFCRFGIARRMQDSRLFNLSSDFSVILQQIDEIIAAPIAA